MKMGEKRGGDVKTRGIFVLGEGGVMEYKLIKFIDASNLFSYIVRQQNVHILCMHACMRAFIFTHVS